MFHRLLITVALLLTTAGCATIESATGVDRVYQAAIADTATTAVALTNGAHELNPLGFAGASIGKLVYLYIRKDLTAEQQSQYDRVATSLWTGAAANNAVQILAPGTGLLLSLSLGIYVGLTVWTEW
jgi:uncharacterized protein YceK